MVSVESPASAAAPARATTETCRQSPASSARRAEDRGARRAGQLWAVVLAGGDGRRVSALTRDVAGESMPKQYCAFGSDEPLLRRALRRAAAVAPWSRILVVVAAHHRRYWQQTLADVPAENVIVQPRNRGTAAGILLPVLDIVLRRDRGARVLVLPADHHVDSEDVLRRALLGAGRAVRRPDAPVVMLGMTGHEGDHGEYGRILPSPGRMAVLRAVGSFVEKPDPNRSRELADAGALVNSFIFVSVGRTLIRLFEEALPELVQPFVQAVLAGGQNGTLCELYDRIPSHDFSRAVLEACPGSLAVLAVAPCGWSDLGTPSRLERFLGRPPRHREALAASSV